MSLDPQPGVTQYQADQPGKTGLPNVSCPTSKGQLDYNSLLLQ